MEQGQRGWHSRGYIPHFDGDVSQFVTFRLFDSLPQGLLKTLSIEADNNKLQRFYEDAKCARVEEYLDNGIGQCFLRRPEIASIVMDGLRFHADKSYQLFAWAIMPNHVHMLIRPNTEISLSYIMKSLKGFTSNQANKVLGRGGRFWQPDYFDRYIRDREHFEKTVRYIEDNPVKAGLCGNASEWKFSSANPEVRTVMSAFR